MPIFIPPGFETELLSKLKPHKNNIKIHPKKQIEGIAEAIKLVGFVQPIVIDKKYTIRAGHGRFEAAKLLEMERVPVVKLEKLTEEQLTAYMILDNALNESKWNKETMGTLLLEIKTFDFEPFHVSFDEFEKTPGLADYEPPEPRPETKIKKGDMFRLGDHCLLCGDSTNPDDVKLLLNSKTVDSVITDPPYGVDYGKKQEYLQTIKKGNRITTPIKNDDKTTKDYQQFTEAWLRNIPFAKYNTIYIFQAGLNYHKCRIATESVGITWGADLVWVKNNMVFGRKDYMFKHEPIFYGWKGRHKFYGPNNRTTVLAFDRPVVSDLHPTMKPVVMMAEIVCDATKKGMTVFDPFGGSGSTLIACEQTERVCYCIEFDPVYVQVIVDRWEKITGRRAEKI